MKRILQIVTAAVLAVTWTGCGPTLPAKEDVKNRLASDLPSYLSVQGIEIETIPIGKDGSNLCKFGITVASKENLFIKGSSKQAAEIQADLLDRSVTGEISENVHAVASKAVMEFLSQRNFLIVGAEKGKPIILHGSIIAGHNGKEWRWGSPQFEQAAVIDAKPISVFPANSLAEGSPEAASAIEGLRKKIQEIEIAEKRQKEKTAADLAVRKEGLLNLFKPGSKFTGQVKSDRWPDPVELTVDEGSDPAGTQLKFRIVNPLDRRMYRDFTGALDPEGLVDSKIAIASASAQRPIGDFKDPRGLFGPVRMLYSGNDSSSVKFFVTEEGLRGEFSGYSGPVIELIKQP